jgi:3-dehydroquinate synthetase
MRTLTVALDARSYPIHIGEGLLARTDLVAAHLKAPLAAIVCNETVAPLYLADFSKALRELGVGLTEIVLPDGEEHKNWQTLNHIFDSAAGEPLRTRDHNHSAGRGGHRRSGRLCGGDLSAWRALHSDPDHPAGPG